MMNCELLDREVALVTGAASGIGRETALLLARHGATVIASDLKAEGAQTVVQTIISQGGNAYPLICDVSNSESVNEIISKIKADFGRIDILVNSAGITLFSDIESCTDEEWDKQIRVNLTSQFYTIRAVFPIMKEQGGGRIVNVSSSSALSGSNFGGVHYAASKAGILGLTKGVSRRGAPHGIRCNAICPGLTDTPMANDPDAPPGAFDNIVEKVPMGRIAYPDDIAKAILFLVSDYSGYVTGITLNVTGGRYFF